MADTSITILGTDAAALIVAAQEWGRVSNRVYPDAKSQDIANYGVFLGMAFYHGRMYYTVVLTPLYFPCLPRCTVAASDWQIRIDAETFQPGHFQSVGFSGTARSGEISKLNDTVRVGFSEF